MFETMTSALIDEYPDYLRPKKMIFHGVLCFIAFLLGIPCVTRVKCNIFSTFYKLPSKANVNFCLNGHLNLFYKLFNETQNFVIFFIYVLLFSFLLHVILWKNKLYWLVLLFYFTLNFTLLYLY